MSEKLKKLFNKHFYWLLTAIVFFETASYFGYIFPNLGNIFFWLITASVLILSLKNLRYGAWLAIIELLISSKGYLFSANISGTEISIRIAIWLILMSVWLVYFLSSFFKKVPEKKSIFLKPETYRQNYLYYFFGLFFFIAIGLINGLLHNDFADVFLDFNGWLYFALLFPLFESIFNKNIAGENPLEPIFRIFSVAISWLFLKTFILLFFFSHITAGSNLMKSLYHWVRDTGVGEITMMPFGFVRIFFQSHIFILVAFYVLLMIILKFWDEIKINKKLLVFLILAQTAITSLIIISYSRSFWVGLVAAFPFFSFVVIKKYGWKKFLAGVALTTASIFLAIGLVAGTVNFPFPKPGADFNITDALSDRASRINNEAAASSRYALLPELWREIKNNFIFGGGFGRTVTYRTSDPRILENNSSGYYTTYAFEWGWLDVWLKIGLFGMLFYLFFFGKIIIDALKKESWLADCLAISLLTLAVINFFTPYINHPLGIGLFLFSAVAVYLHKKPSSCA
ncbi:MAG: O-antigen ligase family protein [Patescibacteria group bacterium]|jgi:hypothetical protein